jgi:hypothetical protein
MPKTKKKRIAAGKAVANRTTNVTEGKANKSAFVRSLPTHMPAKAVVEKAKAHGMNMSVAYVYSIRTAARASGNRVTAALVPRAGRGVPTAGHAEDLLRAVAAELGLSRALGILEGEQAKVRAILGG